MATPTQAQLARQLAAARKSGLFALLVSGAEKYGLPAAFVLAIASRETNLSNILGDYRHNEAHGVGVMQIDIQHTIARLARDSGSWKTHPEPLIDFGCRLLSENRRRARQEFPHHTELQHLKVAASGYNCGIGNAIAGSIRGDSDTFTTGSDYGRDVMARTHIFEGLLKA